MSRDHVPFLSPKQVFVAGITVAGLGLVTVLLIDEPWNSRDAIPSPYQTRQTEDGGDWSADRVLARAEKGDAKAMLALGVAYADGTGVPQDYDKAVVWLRQSAEAGEAVAQYRMGVIMEAGRGVSKDPAEAFRWYAEAPKQGHRAAMHNLAVAYAKGAGTDKDPAEAAHWFQAAAELGLTNAQYDLAVLYSRGLGVKPSLAEAYRWYSIAATGGDTEARAHAQVLSTQIPARERNRIDEAVSAFRPQPMKAEANVPPRMTLAAER